MRTANQKAWNVQQQVEGYARQALKDSDREAGDSMEVVMEAIQDKDVEKAFEKRLEIVLKEEGHMRAMEIVWAIEEKMEG